MKRIAYAVVAIVAVAIAGCSAASSGSTHKIAAVASTVPISTPSTPSCADQISSWYNNGQGKVDLDNIASDAENTSSATQEIANSNGSDPGAYTNMQSVLASFSADVQALQANMPPGCVPNMDKDLSASLTDFSTAITDLNNGMTYASQGDYTDATTLVVAGDAKLEQGNLEVEAAAKDVQAITPS